MAKCLKFCPSYPTSFRYGGIVARSTLPTEAWTSRLCCASSGTWPSHQCPNPFVIHCVCVFVLDDPAVFSGFQFSAFSVFVFSAWVSRSGCCTQAALPDELQRASFVGYGSASFRLDRWRSRSHPAAPHTERGGIGPTSSTSFGKCQSGPSPGPPGGRGDKKQRRT